VPSTLPKTKTEPGDILVLDPDRYFDPEPGVRRIARSLYDSTRELPLVCPHGHVDPRLLADNAAFPEPAALLIIPDHYILRMLYSQGVTLEAMGIVTLDGTPVETDPREIWQLFADRVHLFRGTPTGAWLAHELYEVFGVREKLSGRTARSIYDEIAGKLEQPEYRPRALFERFNIEVLATTDRATDSLEHHKRIAVSGWNGRVIPSFRPDALFRISAAGWRAEVEALAAQTGKEIVDYPGLVAAIELRRDFFREMGATSTDHAVIEPYTQRLSGRDAGALLNAAFRGEATVEDERIFQGHMLMEMARMSMEDGLVMQIHPGSLRDHNSGVAARFGPDMGADIPVATEYTRNLRPLLEAYGNDARLRLILFTLDESTYARELAPLAGHYPALRLGPPWWFHDSIEGMRRFREQTTETAGIYNTAGFNDDTRAFCSIPARHDLSRRVDANYLAGLVSRHVIDLADAREMARALAYDLVRETYRLDASTPVAAR
jgi:glucuronate isomerase